MSGDSPQSHRNDIILFVAPTTSKEVAIQSTNVGNTCFVQAAVPVEKDKEKDEEDKVLCPSILSNNSCDDSRNSDPDKTVSMAELANSGKKRKEKEKKYKFRMCKGGGKTKIKNHVKSEECTVACLYYMIQCCECTIV
ncbi:uncharacterized protein [Leptinotarsa decemlineata]|uniref:uncharacterized protein n=1 Tax=Leptinotarsa decemlineata TaxID=7539 RepID=UPI000C251C77|nr:uncharacterized protein LOC111502236 [Leptinotarsa decemlineata]